MEYLIEIINDFIIKNEQLHYEYFKEQESHITRRETMISDMILKSEILQKKREQLELEIKIHFEEKESLRNLLEQNLNKAIENADSVTADIILKFIETIYSNNPFNMINHNLEEVSHEYQL